MLDDLEFLPDFTSQAFHGTTKDNADSILSGSFLVGTGPDLFVGNGVYFYDGDVSAAIFWAKNRVRADEPTAIQAYVVFGRCIDLMVRSHRGAIVKIEKGIRKLGIKSVSLGQSVNFLALKILGSSGYVVDTIRASEVNLARGSGAGAVSYFEEQATYFTYSRRVVCVREVSMITSPRLASS